MPSRATTTTAAPRVCSAGAGTAAGSSVATRAMTSSGLMRSSPVSVRLERALAPDVDQTEREHHDEDHHLDETEQAEPSEEERPRIEENHLDVEDDEEDGGEIELDREASPRGTAGDVAALERLSLHCRRTARSEERGHREKEARHDRGQREHAEHRTGHE